MIIKLENISFSYPERGVIFEDLNFEIYKGDRIGIKGANGSGKTTLLYIIVGLLKPQKGNVIIFGKNMEKESDFYEVRKKIGFLFQDSDDQLFSHSERYCFWTINLD
jgi:ABC-type cobalt transport system, ATPase component